MKTKNPIRLVYLWVSSIILTQGSLAYTPLQDYSPDLIDSLDLMENQELRRLWTEHIVYETETMNTSGLPVQEECQPRFYPAAPQVERRGMAMFFHGFTACPQQYFDIAELLAKRGYDVYLPLMPGQGRQPTGKKDYLKDLPVKTAQEIPRKHWRLVEFVEKMNQIAKHTTGERIILGLSGGAGLATGAAIAGENEHGNEIWSRALLYAPYYEIPGPTRWLAEASGLVKLGLINDWGETCRVNRAREQGRNGYCSVTGIATLAMVHYGDEVAQETHKLTIPVQFVGVEHDPTADNRAMRRAYQRFQDKSKVSFCFYPKGTPHSLIRPTKDILPRPEKIDFEAFGYQTADDYLKFRGKIYPLGPYEYEDKPEDFEWVWDLQQDTVAFVTKGEFFRQGRESLLEKKYGNNFNMCVPEELSTMPL